VPQRLPLPHRPSSRESSGVFFGPSFGSSRGTFNRALRASASSGPEPLDQANDNLKLVKQALGRKQANLAAEQQTLDSLLQSAPGPTQSRIAEAKRDVAKAKRDVAEADLEAFLQNNPRPSSSDVAATRDFEVNKARFERNLAKAEWDLSTVDLDFAQARNASNTELDQKRKKSETLKAVFEGLALEPTSGQPEFPADPHWALYAM
jgi:hypothetical protein